MATGQPIKLSIKAEGQPISIKVQSWNINGAGFGTLRRTMVSRVVSLTKPDVILLQEIYPLNTPEYINSYPWSSTKYKWVKAAGNKEYESQVLYDGNQYAQIEDTDKLFHINSDVDNRKSLSFMLNKAKDRVFAETRNLRVGTLDDLKTFFNERISIAGLRIRTAVKVKAQ